MKQKQYMPSKDKHLTEAIQQHLREAQYRGLSVGAKTMCSTVMKKLEEITNESSAEDMYAAIEAVRSFCSTALGLASN